MEARASARQHQYHYSDTEPGTLARQHQYHYSDTEPGALARQHQYHYSDTEPGALARQHQYHYSDTEPGAVQCKTGIIVSGHRPLCVYPLSTQCHCTSRNLSGTPSILQANKDWRWEWPGNEARYIYTKLCSHYLVQYFGSETHIPAHACTCTASQMISALRAHDLKYYV